MGELINCPFCGGKAVMVKTTTCGRYVMCWDCDARTEESVTDDIGTAHEKAVAAWNRRHQPESEPLTLDQLRQMDGEPLYVIPLDADADWEGHWSIMQTNSVTAWSLSSKGKMYFLYEADYGKTWLAYRTRPQEVEDG